MTTIDPARPCETRNPERNVDALQLALQDNVATLLHAIEAGSTCVVAAPDGPRTLKAIESIPIHHKIALEPIATGEPLRKYGEIIGEARRDIAVGAHVHIHNLISRRAR